MWPYYYNDGFGWGILGGFMMIIFWIVLISFIVWLVKGAKWKNMEHWHNDSAMNILKERYAKGEINKEEFDAKKKDLMS